MYYKHAVRIAGIHITHCGAVLYIRINTERSEVFILITAMSALYDISVLYDISHERSEWLIL